MTALSSFRNSEYTTDDNTGAYSEVIYQSMPPIPTLPDIHAYAYFAIENITEIDYTEKRR
jgi:hypothetical protein